MCRALLCNNEQLLNVCVVGGGGGEVGGGCLVVCRFSHNSTSVVCVCMYVRT